MRRGFFAVCLLSAALAAAAVPAHAERDAVQFFGNIEVTPTTPVHDAVCFFCSVHADGDVHGDIVVFFGDVRLDGRAHRDVVNFFGQVRAADGSSIGRDLVSLFGSVHLGENVTVGRDMVSVFGSQHVAASASVGRDRVRIPGIVLYGPLLLILAVIFVIVYEVRARHRRFAQSYPYPPRP